jgi:hypothetical protein
MDRIRFLAWNIYGIDNDVLNDDMFNSYLDDNDIVILLETWLEMLFYDHSCEKLG